MTKLTIRHPLPADQADALALPPHATRARIAHCATCGQSFDMRKLALAYHHGPEPHDPL